MNKADKVRNFWQNRATDVARDDEVTHRDIWQRYLEIETIKKFLYRGRLIDIGCGNGFTTKLIASKVKEVIGIDSSKEMIARAKIKKKRDSRNVIFYVANVLSLKPSDFGMFDIAIVERCLINLAGWQEQEKAMKNIASILNKDGRFILVEGLKDGRDSLNKLRVKMGLEPMPKVWHNVDFNEKQLLNFLDKYFEIEDRVSFGIYDFVSRILYPLMVFPKLPKYRSKFNKMAASLALIRDDFNDISRIIFLVLKKK